MNDKFEYQMGSPMRLLYLIFRTLLLTGLLSISQAQQLQWDAEELTFSPAPGDLAVIAHFKFKNIGKAEARIISVNSSCSCTNVSLEKKNFAPGESAEVNATFTIGVRTGLQEKIILVESNDIVRPSVVLKIKVAIPEVVQVNPTFLYWSPTESLVPKEIAVKVLNSVPVRTITVESSSPKIAAKVEPVNIGQEYRIVVVPSETDLQIMALLSIKTDYPPENPKTFYVNVRVQPKK